MSDEEWQCASVWDKKIAAAEAPDARNFIFYLASFASAGRGRVSI